MHVPGRIERGRPVTEPPEAGSRGNGGGSLPTVAEELIARVAARTRLYRSEREGVRLELASHFHEGLARGRSAEDLIAAFGDERRTAKLIRRAKLRGRHWSRRLLRRATHMGLIIIAGTAFLYSAAAVVLFTGRPTVTVDEVAAVFGGVDRIPMDERAWPAYLEALLEIRAGIDDGAFQIASSPPDPDEPVLEEWPDTWDETVARLPSLRPGLDLLYAASQRPSFGFDPRRAARPGDPDFAAMERLNAAPVTSAVPWTAESGIPKELVEGSFVALPGAAFVDLRRCTTLLAADTRARILGLLPTDQSSPGSANEEGAAGADADRPGLPARNILTILNLQRHLHEAPGLFFTILSTAQTREAAALAIEVLESAPALFSDADLVMLSDAFALARERPVHLNTHSERRQVHDLVQRLYSDNGRGNGRLTWQGLRALHGGYLLGTGFGTHLQPIGVVDVLQGPLLMFTALDRAAVLRASEERFDRLEALQRIPLWERTSADTVYDAMDLEDQHSNRYNWRADWRRDAGRFHWTPADILTRQVWLTRADCDAALAAIAIERAHRDLGGGPSDWPDSLASLIPEYLPVVPVDLFDGRPLRYVYRKGEGLPVLYSIGLDGDDDFGLAPVIPEGDFLLAPDYWRPRDTIDAKRDPVADDEEANTSSEGVAAEAAVDQNQTAAVRPHPRGVANGDWILFTPTAEASSPR